MDLVDVMRIAVRRWYVFVPLLALTAAATLLAGNRVAPEYEAEASVVLVAPPEQAQDGQDPSVNPYEILGTETTAQAMEIALSSTRTRRIVEGADNDPDYEITAEDRSPIMSVSVRTDSLERALGTVRQVLDLLEQELDERQDRAQVPENSQITLQSLVPADTALEVDGGVNKVRAAVIAVGLVLAVGAALLVDVLATARQRRRHVSSRSGDGGEVDLDLEDADRAMTPGTQVRGSPDARRRLVRSSRP